MTAAQGRALVVGEALIDVTRRSDGTESAMVGGSPLNVAVGLARLDVQTTLAAQVGDDDDYGEMIRDHVDASDVDLRSLPPHRGDTATAVAVLDRTGAATYEFDLQWDPSELPSPEGFDVVHAGSIATALQPGADAVRRLVEDAVAHGIAVSLDPNVRPSITPDLADVRSRFEQLASMATVLKCSDEDVELLRPGMLAEEFAQQLLASGPRIVAITRAGAGAMLAAGDVCVDVEAPAVVVADTIGAGDSFMAALLAGLLERRWLARSAYTREDLGWLGELAVAAAAITVSRPGADPPRRRELVSVGSLD